MAEVVITAKVMPESPDVDLMAIEEKANEVIKKYGDVGKSETEELAFGLKALKLIFVMDESKGSPDALEEDIAKIDGVRSVEIVDVRRAIG